MAKLKVYRSDKDNIVITYGGVQMVLSNAESEYLRGRLRDLLTPPVSSQHSFEFNTPYYKRFDLDPKDCKHLFSGLTKKEIIQQIEVLTKEFNSVI